MRVLTGRPPMAVKKISQLMIHHYLVCGMAGKKSYNYPFVVVRQPRRVRAEQPI